MDASKMSELRKNGKTDEIAAWAKTNGIDTITDSNELFFVAEAFENLGDAKNAISAYEKALYELEDELVIEKLFSIFRQLDDKAGLEKFRDFLDETGMSYKYTLLSDFEIARISNTDPDEQIALLKEYLEDNNDEAYYILLLELLSENIKENEAKRYLRQYDRLFLNSSLGAYINPVRELIESSTNGKSSNSIRKLIYARTLPTLYSEEKVQNKPETTNKSSAFAGSKVVPKADNTRIKTVSLKDAISNLIPKQKKKLELSDPISINERFANVAGMENIKKELGNVYRAFKSRKLRESNDFVSSISSTTNFVITGKKGAGKTMLAEKVGQLLADFGIRGSENAVYVDAKEFDGQLGNLSDVTLIIENVGEVIDEDSGKYGQFAYNLKKILMDPKNVADLSIILTGTKEAIDKLYNEDSDIRHQIYTELAIEDYTNDELLDMFKIIARKQGWRMEDDTYAYVKKQLARERNMPTFEWGKSIIVKLQNAEKRLADRLEPMDDPTDYDMATLVEDDFELEGVKKDVTKILEKLDELEGLDEVKEAVQSLVSTVIANNKAEEMGSHRENSVGSLHMVFTGNPGTGKTTVARMIADIYMSMGVLPGNKEGLVEVSAGDLTSMYVGGTTEKTREVINRAMGGVLFIDEAYRLASSATGSGNDLGKQVIEELLKVLEDSRDSIMVILAGYTKEMNDFMNVNAGLRSRITKTVHFADYTPEQMYSIFKSMVDKRHMYLDKGISDAVKELIKKESQKKDFGNARGVRNIVDMVCAAQQERITEMIVNQITPTANDFEIIRKEDIERASNTMKENSKSLEELLDDLNSLEGLTELKEIVQRNVNKVVAANKRKEAGGDGSIKLGNLHMVFQGNPGTGKTTVARKIGLIYRALGILPSGETIIEGSRDMMVGRYQGETALKVKDIIDQARGGVLFIDEAYTLNQGEGDNFGREAIDALVAPMENNGTQFMVILAGYTQNMQDFLSVNPGLKSRIGDIVTFEDFTIDQMKTIFLNRAKKDGYKVNEDAVPYITRLIEKRAKDDDFGNARGVRKVFEDVLAQIDQRVAVSDSSNPEDFYIITKEDVRGVIGDEEEISSESLEDILKNLDSMIGLQAVKTKVHEIVDGVEYNKICAEKGLPTDDKQSLHLMFKGNPGTGKTTIAKYIAKIYKQLGVLRTGQLIEVKPADLIQQHVGETAPNTRKMINLARGGIFFVDEAYGLNDKGSVGYGKDAIDVILTEMENNRDDLMVIFAGYDKDLDELMSTNAGLKSRFPDDNVLHFEDYTEDELVRLFVSYAKSDGFTAEEELLTMVGENLAEKKKEMYFGNGRTVRNLYESIKAHQKQRVVRLTKQGADISKEDFKKLIAEDY